MRAVPQQTVFMECDIQEKLRKHIFRFATVAHNANRLNKLAGIHDIPLIACQQKGFGDIAAEIEHPASTFYEEKLQFSMCTPKVNEHLESLKKTNVVLYGIEAHVCMRQTAFDLLEMGYDVHVVVDACSSMQQHDRNVGMESMAQQGVTMVTF